MLLNLVTPLHEATNRDYLARLMDDKVACMKKAREFEYDYWDGDRRYGYGGYKYDGRWAGVAKELIERYGLKNRDSVLDIGCGKGHLLYEMQKILPGLRLHGLDRSRHALTHMPDDIEAHTYCGMLTDLPQFADHEFALVVSLGCLHNLTLSQLSRTLPEIARVARQGYIMVESFRDEAEWFNLCAWCLTAETLMRPEDWEFLFEKCGYKGDHEFIFFN